jgi:antitoxin VapB
MLGPMPKQTQTIAQRHVRLFRNGRNQAVRIPREFELPGKEATMRKEGDRLVVEPAPPRSLLAVLATFEPIEEEFPAIEELPHTRVDL